MAGPPGRFDPTALSATPGTVVFYLENLSQQGYHTLAIGTLLHHALVISGPVSPGQAAVFTVENLPAGEYSIWCTVDGHAADGMTGTLSLQ